MSNFTNNDSELQMDSCLILCIEEYDKSSIDTRMFIGYDVSVEDYFVRGKRQDIRGTNYVPYAFHCESADKLYKFIELIVGIKGVFNTTLYNYNNLENKMVDEITYEYLESLMDKNYEIVGYDGVILTEENMLKSLNVLKYMYNLER